MESPASGDAPFPVLIQGGMGVGVSNWQLARAVALAGEKYRDTAPALGVVSCTAPHNLMTNRLQNGDPGGHVQRALAAFPFPHVADDILNKYYRNVRRVGSISYRLPPKISVLMGEREAIKQELIDLLICGNFVEVWLAKEGHDNPIGANFLEKVQLPRLFELYGAMLAGVDYVLIGAGIPTQIPGILDRYAAHEPASYKVDVIGSKERYEIGFDPRTLPHPAGDPQLKRPRFLAIITSEVLAKVLTTRASGYVDGFIIEGPLAGGHNAPPRGPLKLNDVGEPVYGERDVTDLEEIKKLGRPFWLAGTYNSPERVQEALALGAQGVQCGTIFAYSDEAGIRDDLKADLRRKAFRGELVVRADPKASPSGFPFQVAQIDGTLSDPAVYGARQRICDLGYLVEAYQTRGGKISLRCPAEPVAAFVQKGGKADFAEGRKCICNGLLATTGLGLSTKTGPEPPIVTSGQDYSFIRRMIQHENGTYSAAAAVDYLLAGFAAGGAAVQAVHSTA